MIDRLYRGDNELFGVAAFKYDHEKSARPRTSGQTGKYRFWRTLKYKVLIKGPNRGNQA